MTTIAADPRHLGAQHRHHLGASHLGPGADPSSARPLIVPGGGISLDGTRWVACRPDFFLPVRVLSCLFRGLFLPKLVDRPPGRPLEFFGVRARLDNHQAFRASLAPLRKSDWVVYAKRPFGGPRAVLAYLSRYTHRVAIANSRLVAADEGGCRSAGRTTEHRRTRPWKT